MRRVLFYWSIGSFLYFKVAFDAAFSSASMTVIAALLLAVMVCMSVGYSSYFYAIKNGQNLARMQWGRGTGFLRLSLPIWGTTALINALLGKVIVFGFSKELNLRVSAGDLFFRGSYHAEKGWLFVLLILVPVTLHYALILASIYTLDKRAGNGSRHIEEK